MVFLFSNTRFYKLRKMWLTRHFNKFLSAERSCVLNKSLVLFPQTGLDWLCTSLLFSLRGRDLTVSAFYTWLLSCEYQLLQSSGQWQHILKKEKQKYQWTGHTKRMFKLIEGWSGMNGKNLFLPSRSRESPASTPSFSMHLPISASSDLALSWRHRSELLCGHDPVKDSDSLIELASSINIEHWILKYWV